MKEVPYSTNPYPENSLLKEASIISIVKSQEEEIRKMKDLLIETELIIDRITPNTAFKKQGGPERDSGLSSLAVLYRMKNNRDDSISIAEDIARINSRLSELIGDEK